MVTNGPGNKFSLTEGDWLVVKVEISGLQLVTGGFFPALELREVEVGRK